MIKEIKNMIAEFLDGKCDPYEFSFTLPRWIINKYDAIEKEDSELAYTMDDVFSDICAEYENEDPEPFMKKMEDACEEIFGQNWRNA